MAGMPLRDSTRVPCLDELLETIGDAVPRWRRLDSWLAETYGLASDPVFFGRDSGWCARYRRGGKTLLTLIPSDLGFRALVVVGPSAWQVAAALPLSSRTRAAWDRARPYADGRWLWLEAADDETIADIELLVTAKSPPPRHPRPRASTLPGWTEPTTA